MAFIELPAERVPVVAETEVLVVGGGAAGLAAAVASARAGADTLVVERYGYLGGMASGGLIILLLTLDDGNGRQVVGGVCQEMVDRLWARGAAYFPPRDHWGLDDEGLIEHYRRWGLVWGRGPHRVRYSVAFDPEEFKFVAVDMLEDAGARLRLHTWAVRPVVEGEFIRAVVFLSKAGLEAITCRVVVDATGDGDIFAAGGEAYEKELVTPWLWFRMGNVQALDRAIELGKGRFFRSLGGWFFRTLGEGRALMPWGASDHTDRRIDATSPDDLTYAEVQCRRLVRDEVDRLRREVPGFENAYINDIAPQLGITESRRLAGMYVLRAADVNGSFDDVVALTGNWTRYGDLYRIPYRSLLPRRLRNLLVAGRCIAVEHKVHHATKEIPACMATGQAAGVAAALAARAGIAVHQVDVRVLQERLREQGAILD